MSEPYLISGITVDRPDQVWAADITYIRLAHGFVYLTAIMDWHSRYVVAWELSTTLDRDFCLEALGTALRRSKPEIFNTDQGPQFTSEAFPAPSRAPGTGSRWTAAAGYRTTSSSSGCGDR